MTPNQRALIKLAVRQAVLAHIGGLPLEKAADAAVGRLVVAGVPMPRALDAGPVDRDDMRPAERRDLRNRELMAELDTAMITHGERRAACVVAKRHEPDDPLAREALAQHLRRQRRLRQTSSARSDLIESN